MRNILYSFLIVLILITCKREPLPKPKAYLSLTYPKKSYKTLGLIRPYTFEILKGTKELDMPKNWLKIEYPNLKASIDITYRPINNNLKELFLEAEKIGI